MLMLVNANQIEISQQLANNSNHKVYSEYLSGCSLIKKSTILHKIANLIAIDMATLPQGAFAACKVREQLNGRDRESMVSCIKPFISDKTAVENLKQREYSPDKYNGKLMNSIWGLYNRYSPHNVKKNEYAPPKY